MSGKCKCKGGVPCLLNPLGVLTECYACPQYGGKPPPVPRAMPGYEEFTVHDNPAAEDAIETVCPVCGRLFYAPKNKVYCSRFCKKKAYRLRRAERGGVNCKFTKRRCLVCGRWYRPKTSNQVTCGGVCTQKYFAKKYRRGVAINHTPMPPQSCGGVVSTMETRTNCPAQHLRECVEQIKRHNPYADVTPSSLDSLAAVLSKRLSWFRTMSRPRQAVLLDIAVTYGVNGLCSMERFILAARACKWEQARQALLNSRYASMAGRGAVENARQLVTSQWTVIPQYIPSEDDDEEEEEEPDDGIRFF